MIEEANKKRLRDDQVASLTEVFAKDPARNIIDFESGRRALENHSLNDEQNRVRRVERNRLSCRLPYDWLELLLVIVLLAGSLLSLVGGLIASWRF